MIDLHCHALPSLDDGQDDMQGPIALARAAAESGTRTLVTTPHIDHWWNVDRASVAGRLAELRAAIADAGIDLDLRARGEIALGAQPQSLIAAITIPIATKTTTAICIQIQVGDTPRS